MQHRAARHAPARAARPADAASRRRASRRSSRQARRRARDVGRAREPRGRVRRGDGLSPRCAPGARAEALMRLLQAHPRRHAEGAAPARRATGSTFGMIVGIPLMQMLLFGYAINFDVRGSARGRGRRGAAPASSRALRRRPAGDAASCAFVGAEPGRRRTCGGGSTPARSASASSSRPISSAAGSSGDRRRRAAARRWQRADDRQRRARARDRPDAASGTACALAPARAFEVRTEYNPERRTAVQVVPALIGVILNMTMVIFTAVAIVRERERGNLELLITTPIRSVGADGRQAAALRAASACVQTTLMLVIGASLFDVPVNGRPARPVCSPRDSSSRRR